MSAPLLALCTSPSQMPNLLTCFSFPSILFLLAASSTIITSLAQITSLPNRADLGASFNTSNGPILTSPNSTFVLWPSACSSLSVVHYASKEIVWDASPLRNISASASGCSLTLGEDGDLVLGSTVSAEKVWSSNTSGMGIRSMELLESGNLVLRLANRSADPIWQSFDYPSDTLLQGQAFKPGMQLTSAGAAEGTTYSFAYEGSDAYLMLSFLGGESAPFWMVQRGYRASSKAEAYLVFDSGNLNWYANDSSFVALSNFQTVLTAESANYLWGAKLGTDGNLQAYFWANDRWISTDAGQALTSNCQKPDACGPYGMCQGQGQCQCVVPSSFQQISSDPSQGCEAMEPLNCTHVSSNLTGRIVLVNFTGIDYFSNAFSVPLLVSSQECQRLCLANCSCAAAFYYNNNDSSNSCYHIQNLRTVQSVANTSLLASVKVFQKSTSAAAQPSPAVPPPSPPTGASAKTASLVAACLGGTLGLGLICLAWCWYYKIKKQKAEMIDDERFLQSLKALPPRFSYKEMTIATERFSRKLGSGGFGSVYEGVLAADKSRVAVKQLEEASGQGRKQFRAEIATIGCICHLNVVCLRGFCLEGKHRLLIYEFMANGSLEKALFPSDRQQDDTESSTQQAVLDWQTRYQIALGTARGLAYLHEECTERIIHLDIKPDNILLDENKVAKLADFGLSKLVDRQESKVVTEMRGTRGYLAPEWLSNVPIGEKTDVYSFGMVLLELVSGRRSLDVRVEAERCYLPSWAFTMAMQGRREFMEMVDERILDRHSTEVDEEEVRRVIEIGLWCIQEEVSLRPSMGSVVKMLEGLLEVSPPPIPPENDWIA